jgi:hypothetical protein
MYGKRYYGPAIAGLGAGFFLGFLLAGEGVIPYSVLTKAIVLLCGLGLVVAGQMLARSAKPPRPSDVTDQAGDGAAAHKAAP